MSGYRAEWSAAKDGETQPEATAIRRTTGGKLVGRGEDITTARAVEMFLPIGPRLWVR